MTTQETQPPLDGGGKGEVADSSTVDQCLTMLRRKDDTSRFVGLAILSSLLNHIQDPSVLSRCLDSIDPRFLDRLLRAGGASKNKSEEEARNLVELAVNVVHAFATVLPDAAESERLVGRVPLLIEILPQCSKITQATTLQTLLVFSTGSKGSRVLVSVGDLSPLVKCSVEHETALQVLQHAFVNSLPDPDFLRSRLEAFLGSICEDAVVVAEDKAVRLKLLSFLSDLVARLPSELLPVDMTWVKPTYAAIRAVIISGADPKTRADCTKLAASLLHKYPPALLFGSSSLGKSPSSVSDKPFVYIFMQLVLIDLRAAFPSLMEQLATPSYGSVAHRLASDFDVLAAFLGYLLMVDDFEDIPLDPGMLLKLKSAIGETFGLTLEFLRDRWDAAYAGAAGFEPGFERDVRLSLTWDTKLEGGIVRDPLVIAAIRALSLWLKEDESLREESGGLTDLFLGLWKKGKEDGVDYRFWILSALEGTVEEENGREQFLKYGGLDLVWGDLKTAYLDKDPHQDDLRLVMDETRLLTQVLTLEDRVDAAWAENVVATANQGGYGDFRPELDSGIVRLASACLTKLHKADRRRLGTAVEKLREGCQKLYVAAREGKADDGVMELLSEAIEELDELGM